MPSFVVTSPDGKEYQIDAPEGATQDQVMSYAQQSFQGSPAPSGEAQPEAQEAPSFSLNPSNAEERQVNKDHYNEIARQIGLTARYGIEGLTSLPGMVANVPAALSNKFLGTHFTDQNASVSSALSEVGLPEPQGAEERIIGDISRSLVGSGGLAKAAGTKLAQGISPLVSEAVAANPFIEGVSAATSAGASGVTRELGGGEVAQAVAGLAGGVGGGLAAGLRNGEMPIASNSLFEDIAERGIDDTGAFSKLREMLGNEAAKLQQEISGTFDGAGKKVSPGLFDVAKDRGKDLYINKDAVSGLAREFAAKAKDEIDDDATNIFNTAAKRLQGFTAKNDLNLNDIEGLRRAASQVSTVGGSKGYAGKTVTRDIDEWLTNSLGKDDVSGDRAAIDIWKQAISKRREFGDKFERPQEIAKALTGKTNEEVENTFIGAGGAALNKGLSRVYDSTLKALPKDQHQEAGFVLRQSIINRMVKNAAQSSDSGEGLSATRLGNQIRNFKRDNISMWNKFPDGEKRTLNHLEKGLYKTAKGGTINIVYNAVEKLLRRGLRTNIELPRTLKPKTIVTKDDLLELLQVKPKFQNLTPIATGTAIGSASSKKE